MSTIDPDSVTQFVDFTGCRDESEARKFILMYDNDVGRAADRYFQAKSRTTEREDSHNRGTQQSPVVIDDEEMELDNEPSSSSSRRIPSRHRASSSKVTGRHRPPVPSVDETESGVRRPIPRTRGQLIEESFEQAWLNNPIEPFQGAFNTASTNHRSLAQRQERMLRAATASGTQPNAEAIRKSNALSAMFRPPVDITFVGPWEAARRNAAAANLWLMSNLQSATDFASSCLNRDIWSREMVRMILKKNFFFWQVADNVSDCKRVASYYNITSFPAVFIVDPRTGELVGRLTQLKDEFPFLDQLTTFLDKYPDLNAYDKALAKEFGHNKHAEPVVETPVVPKKPQGKKRKADAPAEVATEEKRSKKLSRTENSASVDEEMPEIDELCNNGTKLTTVDREEWRNLIPPTSSTTPEIQIVLRLPNSEREKISLPNTTPLRAVFVFLDGRGFNSRDHILVLSYPRREYSIETHGKQSLASLGFNRQEVIHVDHK